MPETLLENPTTITGTPAQADTGDTIRVNAPAAGEHYAWTVTKDGKPYKATATDGPSFTFTPHDEGTYVVTVNITTGDEATTATTRPIVVEDLLLDDAELLLLPDSIGDTPDGLARPLPPGDSIGTGARYLFNKQQTATANAIAQAGDKPADQEDELAWLLTLVPEFESEPWQQTAQHVLTPPITDIVRHEGLAILEKLKASPDEIKRFTELASQIAEQLGTALATQANADTQKEVNAAFTAVGEAADIAEQQGQPFDVRAALHAALLKVFTRANEIRAPFYAGDAAVDATHAGELRAAGVTKWVKVYLKHWMAQPGACEYCYQLSQQPGIPIGESWTIAGINLAGKPYSFTVRAPLLHHRCRCSLSYSLVHKRLGAMSRHTPHVGPIGELPGIQEMSAADGAGHWVTINGHPVLIGGHPEPKFMMPGHRKTAEQLKAVIVQNAGEIATNDERSKTLDPKYEAAEIESIKRRNAAHHDAIRIAHNDLQRIYGDYAERAAKKAAKALKGDHIAPFSRGPIGPLPDLLGKVIQTASRFIGPIGDLPDLSEVPTRDIQHMSRGELFEFSALTDPFRPSPEGLAGRPTSYMGKPVSYYWKPLVKVGHYIHPTKKFHMDISPEDIANLAKKGNAMLAEKEPIPINVDHSLSARDAMGNVIAFRPVGDTIEALHQFIGEDAEDLASKNNVSVGLDPNYIDGHGKHWGRAIVHSALTPIPVMSGLGQFVQAASRAAAVSMP